MEQLHDFLVTKEISVAVYLQQSIEERVNYDNAS